MLKNKKLSYILLGVVLVAGVYLVARGWIFPDSEYSRQLEERQAVMDKLRTSVDTSVLQNPEFAVAEEVVIEREISRMPEFSLALADVGLLTNERMQAVGVALGFDDQAKVSRLGSQLIWTQDNRRVSIDTQMGTVDFTTAFNISDANLPDAVPTQDQARQALVEFLSKTGLPDVYLDLGRLEFEYLEIDSGGILAPVSPTGSDAGLTGPLLKAQVPYVVSDVQVVLPVESYILVDGNGIVRALSLLLPNIKQEDRVLRVMSWENAKQQLEAGVGVVIEIDDQTASQLRVDRLSVAYYLNSSGFYTLDQKRILTPVYVFAGEGGKVAVLATQE